MGNVIFTKGLRHQLFQQLAFLLALADVIQVSVTFIGDYGNSEYDSGDDYVKCCIQNYTLQFGVLFKSSVALFIGGVVWHIVRFLKSPQYLYFYLSFCVILPICCVCLSILFNTADVHCTQDYQYEDESDAGQTSYLVLLGVFFAPLYIQLAVLVVAVIAVKVKLSHMEISNPGVELVLRRLMLYPLIFIFSLMPATLLVLFQFLLGRKVLLLELMTGFFVSINGFLVGSVYIRHQRKYPSCVEQLLVRMGGWFLEEGPSRRDGQPAHIGAGSTFSAITFSGSLGGTLTGTRLGDSVSTNASSMSMSSRGRAASRGSGVSVSTGSRGSLLHVHPQSESNNAIVHSPFAFYHGKSVSTQASVKEGDNESASSQL